VPFDDRLDDGQSQSCARGRTASAPACEPFEDALTLGLGDPGASVPDPEHDFVVADLAADGDIRLGRGVLEGVADQVHHRLVQPLLVGGDDGGLSPVDFDDSLAQRGALAGQVGDELGQVEGTRVDEVGLFRLGQSQQILDDARHPIEFGGDEGDRRLAFLRIIAEQFQLTPDHRYRGPQLVSGVVDEPPLCGEGVLEAVEHAVEGHRQCRHLVVAFHLDATGEVGLGDGLRRLVEQAQRPQHPTRRHPCHGRSDHEDRPVHERPDAHDVVHQGETLLHDDRHHEDPLRLAFEDGGHGQVANDPQLRLRFSPHRVCHRRPCLGQFGLGQSIAGAVAEGGLTVEDGEDPLPLQRNISL
jgi:hypothetical protein